MYSEGTGELPSSAAMQAVAGPGLEACSMVRLSAIREWRMNGKRGVLPCVRMSWPRGTLAGCRSCPMLSKVAYPWVRHAPVVPWHMQGGEAERQEGAVPMVRMLRRQVWEATAAWGMFLQRVPSF